MSITFFCKRRKEAFRNQLTHNLFYSILSTNKAIKNICQQSNQGTHIDKFGH
jgi:REP element-mobilizing transposase RayT